MKFFKRLFFAVLLLVALDYGYNHAHDAAQALRNYHHRFDAVTLAQKSSHMVVMYTGGDLPKTECSATAVAPHILLTATHCNENPEEHYTTLTLDYSRQKFHVLAELKDKRDHVLYLLDGPVFTNFVPNAFAGSGSSVEENADVVIYGDGEDTYPPQALYGYVDSAADAADLSDVDRRDGIHYIVMAVRHGDSGSAVYDVKTGRIIGVLTYGFSEHDTDTADHAASFALDFPDDYATQLQKIAAAPKPAPKKAEKKISIEDFAKTLKH